MTPTPEEVLAAAIAENLKNPDGTEITTEEQLIAARELAKTNPPEEVVETPEEKAARELAEAEAQAAEDPLLKVLLAERKTQDQIDEKSGEEELVIEAALDPAAERAKNIATLKEWGITMPDDATDEAIAAKVDEGKPAAAAPAATPAAEPAKPKKGKKFSVVNKESVEIIEPPAAAPVAELPRIAAPAPDADAEYIKTLTDEQRDELYEAEVAEMLEPVKFKDQKKNLLAFYRRFDKEVAEITAAEPDTKLEDNEKFKVLIKAKPVLDAHIVKKVNREIGSREGERRAETKLSPKIAEMEISQRRIEMQPKFQKWVVEQFNPGVDILIERDATSPMTEALKVIKEKGVAEAKKDGYKIEAMIYEKEKKDAARRVEKFLLLKNDAVKFDTDNPDPDHIWIFDYIEKEGRLVADYESKNGRLVDKDRKFLPRIDFFAMLQTNPAEAATFDRRAWKTKSFCTFDDTSILDSLAINTKNTIERLVKEAIKQAEEAGFERRPRVKNTPAAKTPPKTPTELNPPRAVPAAANGAGKLPPTPEPESATIDVIRTNYPHLIKKR
jgi:hypothetical protein